MYLTKTRFLRTLSFATAVCLTLLSGCQVPNQGRLFGPDSEYTLASEEESTHPRSPRHRLAQSLRQQRSAGASAARHQTAAAEDSLSRDGEGRVDLYSRMQDAIEGSGNLERALTSQSTAREEPDAGPTYYSLSDSSNHPVEAAVAEQAIQAPIARQENLEKTEGPTRVSSEEELAFAAPAPVVPADSLQAKNSESQVRSVAYQVSSEDLANGQQALEASLQDLVSSLQSQMTELAKMEASAGQEWSNHQSQLLREFEEEMAKAQSRAQTLDPHLQESLRATLAKLGQMQQQLGTEMVQADPAEKVQEASDSLRVLNLAFCTEVESFGVIKRFPEYRFRAGEQVLLYCELEDFVSRSTDDGFETLLGGKYEILNEAGQVVQELPLPRDVDHCRNLRRDFYIAYRLDLPQEIDSGFYQLRLTIDDVHGQQFGQATIDFVLIR